MSSEITAVTITAIVGAMTRLGARNSAPRRFGPRRVGDRAELSSPSGHLRNGVARSTTKTQRCWREES